MVSPAFSALASTVLTVKRVVRQGRDTYEAARFAHVSALLSSHRSQHRPDLSTATVQRNSDLEFRVAELELELSVLKQTHANILESADREKKAHNVQVSTLNRQISSLETIKAGLQVTLVRNIQTHARRCPPESKPSHSMCHRRRGQYVSPVSLKAGTAGWPPGSTAHDQGDCRIPFPGKRAGVWSTVLLDYRLF